MNRITSTTTTFVISSFALLLASGAAFAQYTDGVVKIGVLTDMASLYADDTGPGSVAAAKLAVEDFGAAAKGMKVEVVYADHQNKPDIGSSIANSWFDVDKVDVILDVPNSAVALAVSEVAKQKNKLFIASGPATSDLTGPKCNANTIHWTYDTWNLANGTGKAMVKTGGDTWFFITADYAFGHALERDTAAVVEANGGKVLGRVRAPLNNNDFSSFLLQAQGSRAKVIGITPALITLTDSRDSPPAPHEATAPRCQSAADAAGRTHGRRHRAPATHDRCRAARSIGNAQIAAVGIAQRQRLATPAIAGHEPALEVDSPKHHWPRHIGQMERSKADCAAADGDCPSDPRDRTARRSCSPPAMPSAGNVAPASPALSPAPGSDAPAAPPGSVPRSLRSPLAGDAAAPGTVAKTFHTGLAIPRKPLWPVFRLTPKAGTPSQTPRHAARPP